MNTDMTASQPRVLVTGGSGFIAGHCIGGATDVIAAAQSGDLQARLRSLPSAPELKPVADPRSFLPGWLQGKGT